LRCRQSGIRCSGPSKSTIFVHSRADTILRQPPRSKLSEAYRSRSTESERSQQFYESSVAHLQKMRLALLRYEFKSSLPRDDELLSGRLFLWKPLYQAIIDEFDDTRSLAIFSGDRNIMQGSKLYSSMALNIRALLPFAAKCILVLDMALFSLLVMYYGRLHANTRLVDLARSGYTAAISQYRRYLYTANFEAIGTTRMSSALFCTSVALCCFEQLDEITASGFGYTAHMDGALRLLQSCGSNITKDFPEISPVLRGFKRISVHVSIQRRQATFLSDPLWNQQLSLDDTAYPRDRLTSLAFEIPGLLDAIDRTQKSACRNPKLPSGTELLLQRIRKLQAKLQSWLAEVKNSIECDLFWTSGANTANRPQMVDSECSPKHQSSLQQLSFANGSVAGLLVHYWSFCLELLMAEDTLQQCLEASGQDCGAQNVSLKANETAQLIMEAHPYLTSCFEGVIGLQLPMETVNRYFARIRS
jgi:hypothetical protein